MRTLGELVEGRPIFALRQNLTVREAARHMTSKKVGAVPVVSGTRLVGFVPFRDLVAHDVALKGTAMKKMMSAAVHVSGSALGPMSPIWRCHACGHLVTADAPPDRCPGCAGPREQFSLLEEF